MTPARLPTVGGNFAWALTGTGVYLACQWGMLVVLARAGSPEKVGQFALGMAVSAPVLLFTNLGLRRVLATDTDRRFTFSDYFGLRLLMNVVALGAIGAVAWGNGYPPETVRVLLLTGVAKAIEAASDVIYGLLQREERMRSIAISQILRGILSLAGLTAGLLATESVVGAVLGMAAGWAAVFLFHDLPRAAGALGEESPVLPRWRGRTLATLARLALPLGVVTMLGSLIASIPCFVIGNRMGEAALGLYTVLASFHAASNRVVSALGESACARLARHFAEGERPQFRTVLFRMLVLSALIGTAGVLFAALAGRPVLRLFFGAPFADHADLLVVLLTVTFLANLQTVFDYAMTAARRFAIQPVLGGLAALLQAAFCAAWIPALGLRGAVLSFAGITLFQLLAAMGIVAHALRRIPPLPTPAVLRES